MRATFAYIYIPPGEAGKILEDTRTKRGLTRPTLDHSDQWPGRHSSWDRVRVWTSPRGTGMALKSFGRTVHQMLHELRCGLPPSRNSLRCESNSLRRESKRPAGEELLPKGSPPWSHRNCGPAVVFSQGGGTDVKAAEWPRSVLVSLTIPQRTRRRRRRQLRNTVSTI